MTDEEARSILDGLETYTDADWSRLVERLDDEPGDVPRRLGVEGVRACATPAEAAYLIRLVAGDGWLADQTTMRDALSFMAGLAAWARDADMPCGLAWANVRRTHGIDDASPTAREIWDKIRFGFEAVYHRTWEV